jgi:hypothetical protein
MRTVGLAPAVAILGPDDVALETEAAGFTIVERAYHGSGRNDARPFYVAKKTA